MTIERFLVITLLIAIVVSLVATVTSSTLYDTQHKKDNIVIDSLIKEIRYHRWKDSIYWEHIGKCSFIKHDQVKPGYDNYLQLTQTSKQGE